MVTKNIVYNVNIDGIANSEVQTQRTCFISHCKHNSEFATYVKQLISLLTNDSVYAFLACDGQSITPGKKWMEEIKKYISQSSVHFVLLTKNSIKKPWVNIEFGLAWSSNINIVPLCFGGYTKDNLPDPYKAFQVIQIDEPFGLQSQKKFANDLALAFGVSKVNQIALRNFLATQEVDLYK